MWQAFLLFRDNINNRKKEITFTFVPLYTYNKLFENITNILQDIGWVNSSGNITDGDNIGGEEIDPSFITFKLKSYKKKPEIVRDWKSYILNRDQIQIEISDPNKPFYGLYTRRGNRLLMTSNLRSIYEDIHIDRLRYPVFIYLLNGSGKRLKLLDVVDNPDRYYNQLITRIVHDYYIQYNIPNL